MSPADGSVYPDALDSLHPSDPQWWWASVIVPIGLALRWLIMFGRAEQAALLRSQGTLVAQLLETNATLRRRTLELEHEVEGLRLHLCLMEEMPAGTARPGRP
jgi:cell division protein FtsB